MIGPVLANELLLNSRRGSQYLFRRIYSGWLIVQLLFYYLVYLVMSGYLENLVTGARINPDAASDFGSNFVELLMKQQLILTLLITPAFTAGAITDEKTRGTLQYLLTADITPWEILFGKLLGRLLQVIYLLLEPLPLICFIGVFGGVSPAAVIIMALLILAPMFAIGSASMLASVWTRQTRDAVLAVYLCAAIGYGLLAGFKVLPWFNPVGALDAVWGASDHYAEAVKHLLLTSLAWAAVGSACLVLAGLRMRGAYLRQLQNESASKKKHWWVARRTDVSDEPIHWKEAQVEGIAPLQFFRRVPQWLGMTVVFLMTLFSSATIIAWNMAPAADLLELLGIIARGNWVEVMSRIRPAYEGFLAQGIGALLMATGLVGLRCSGAVTTEREKQTWEALLLSPLTMKQLIRGKLWGIIRATYPYLIAYALPAVAFSLLGGIGAIFWTLLLLVVAWFGMLFAGAAGLWCSVRSRGSYRSLMGAVGIVYAGGSFLGVIALPLAGVLFLIIMLGLMVLDWYLGSQGRLANWFRASFGTYLVSFYLFLGGLFFTATWLFIKDAEKYVADRERIRIWREEPVSRPRRRRRVIKSSPPS